MLPTIVFGPLSLPTTHLKGLKGGWLYVYLEPVLYTQREKELLNAVRRHPPAVYTRVYQAFRLDDTLLPGIRTLAPGIFFCLQAVTACFVLYTVVSLFRLLSDSA